MRHINSTKGLVAIAFGAGLFLAYCFPGKFIVTALAIILIVAGIFLVKS